MLVENWLGDRAILELELAPNSECIINQRNVDSSRITRTNISRSPLEFQLISTLRPSEKCGKLCQTWLNRSRHIHFVWQSGHRRILFSLKVNRIEQMRTNLLNHSKREENKCTINAVAAATVHRTVSNQTKPSESQIEPYKTESII